MSGAELRKLMTTALERFNAHDLDGYLELYHPRVILHGYPSELSSGRDDVRAFYAGVFRAFPDLTVSLDDLVAGEDRICIRFTLHGTHLGDLPNLAATGRALHLRGISTLHFADGLCVERWQNLDELGMLRELGVIAT